jgi:hypothetical protein
MHIGLFASVWINHNQRNKINQIPFIYMLPHIHEQPEYLSSFTTKDVVQLDI